MSFGESIFSAGFIQKTVKVDLYVRFNRAYPQRNGHQKTLEDSKGLHTEAERQRLPGGAGPTPWAHMSALPSNVGSPPPPRLHLSHPLSRFDLRAHVGRSGLYISAPAPPKGWHKSFEKTKTLITLRALSILGHS